MKKILITGAGGFVGSRILQQWQGKYELCALPKGFFCTADEALTRAQVEALQYFLPTPYTFFLITCVSCTYIVM